MKLKHGLRTKIAGRTGFTSAYIGQIFSCKKNIDSWSTAKKLAAATGTTPILFLEGSQEEIVTQVEKSMSIS